MEVFFLIFQKFFPGPPGPPGGGGEKAEKGPDCAGQPQKKGQNQPAEGEKIHPAPQSHGGHVVNAHLPVVPQKGEGEQPSRGAQPEQQVQQEGQPGQPEAPAQGTHPVVDQPQQGPQQERLPKDRRLTQNVNVHRSAQQPGQEAATACAAACARRLQPPTTKFSKLYLGLSELGS